jgi:hypothetical protein
VCCIARRPSLGSNSKIPVILITKSASFVFARKARLRYPWTWKVLQSFFFCKYGLQFMRSIIDDVKVFQISDDFV